ncbi:trypsin-like peptidase domain-containing protein [Streptomyces sp. NPDC051217]|uniref:trypsin-like peptidase domain-containing protein n=1 Tax=Streptomyces sp. NPDC051217 TaxID=3365644 RepID=UPI0037A3D3B6
MGSGDRAMLVRICDLAGRPRGTGFVADDVGTVITSHEAVDGLVRLVLHAPGERTCLADGDAIVPLPEVGLALVRTEGLDVPPLPISPRSGVEAGTYVRIAAHGWRQARVLGAVPATYTATDRFHLLDTVLELAIGTGGSDALRLGGEASGGPVLDAATGAVLGVIGTALHTEHRAAGLVLPLRAGAAVDPGGALAALLRLNDATVRCYGNDLNLAGVLRLTAAAGGGTEDGGCGSADASVLVERADTSRELSAFAGPSADGTASSDALVLGLVGDSGTGRTTELAALADRRAHGAAPAPTVRLRGADLRADDTSLPDALGRTLRAAGRTVVACDAPGDVAAVTPEQVARLARRAGRPLLVLLDGPEEMPPQLIQALPDWTARTVDWLRNEGAKLVVACRPEFWERAGEIWPSDVLHRPARAARRLPPAVRIGDLRPTEAERARELYGIPAGALAETEAVHPLSLRLMGELREALSGDVAGQPDRVDIFTAHLDLTCLRIAERLAAATAPGPSRAAVGRLAARVAGQAHEAARHCLGPGRGELDRDSFDAIFPSSSGWATAVLAEGLLVPAGQGYRFAHEELGDWLQGTHLDVDAALQILVHQSCPAEAPTVPAQRSPVAVAPHNGARLYGPRGAGPRAPSVPTHRIGPVVHALLLLGRDSGPVALSRRLDGLIDALDRLGDGPGDAAPHLVTGAVESEAARLANARWWGAHLLGEVLLRVPDTEPYLPVLRHLASRITGRSVREGGPHRLGGLAEFGRWFWTRLRVEEAARMDLLRLLLPADGAPETPVTRPRYLDAAADLLDAGPRAVQPLLCRWFTDERPLPTGPGAAVHPTVAIAAQALLHSRRSLGVDDLTEALVAAAHPRADELLTALVEDEPSALCRAVDRWAHDTRPERRAVAAVHAPTAARHVTSTTDRELLRRAALALLTDSRTHGAALGLLVRDPVTRPRHLAQAVAAFVRGDAGMSADALADALDTHPEPVLAAFRARLHNPAADPSDPLTALAELRMPQLAHHVAAVVSEYVALRPAAAEHAARFVERRLERGPAARAALLPLVTGLILHRPVEVRAALARVLAAPGNHASWPLRAELLDVLLAHERRHGARSETPVLHALLRAAALGSDERAEDATRSLVLRTGLLSVRTPDGATRFDRRLVGLARERPGFAALVAAWLAEDPQQWAAVIGPSARKYVMSLGTTMPMRVKSHGHGSLRPA